MNWTIAIIRSILVAVTLRFGGIYIHRNPPKNKFLHRIWKYERKFRVFLIKKYWVFGILTFAIHLVIKML